MDPATSQEESTLKPFPDAASTPVPLKARIAVLEAIEDIVYGSVSAYLLNSCRLTNPT